MAGIRSRISLEVEATVPNFSNSQNFAAFRKDFKSLYPKILILNNKSITDRQINELVEMLIEKVSPMPKIFDQYAKARPRLSHINLSHNLLGPSGAVGLATLFSQPSELRVLDLTDNEITYPGAKYLVGKAKALGQEVTIHLEYNKISEDDYHRLLLLTEGSKVTVTMQHRDLVQKSTGMIGEFKEIFTDALYSLGFVPPADSSPVITHLDAMAQLRPLTRSEERKVAAADEVVIDILPVVTTVKSDKTTQTSPVALKQALPSEIASVKPLSLAGQDEAPIILEAASIKKLSEEKVALAAQPLVETKIVSPKKRISAELKAEIEKQFAVKTPQSMKSSLSAQSFFGAEAVQLVPEQSVRRASFSDETVVHTSYFMQPQQLRRGSFSGLTKAEKSQIIGEPDPEQDDRWEMVDGEVASPSALLR